MAKVTTRFVCSACGTASPRWLGRCPGCSAWNTLVEERVSPRKKEGANLEPSRAPQLVADVSESATRRTCTGLGEFDRVLGGGYVAGSVVLLGGDPGVGKSTLLLQMLASVAARGEGALYITGEESAAQVASRARRIGAADGSTASRNLHLLATNDLADVQAAVQSLEPAAVVVDSVQVLRTAELESAAGTVSQLREVAARLVEVAKSTDAAIFLVGHVTKDGALAGPKVLEHLVDVVLSFEGERGYAFRALRVSKNRFGSAAEVGVFEMRANGVVEVTNPSELFLAERPLDAAGSMVAAVTPQAGAARAVLVEVQALVTPGGGGPGRRTANGIESSRLAMVLAVLERRVGLSLAGSDVFVNVPGGLAIEEPALDLPLALAIASSVRDRPCRRSTVAFGEVGLTGEVRGVSRGALRIREAAALGFHEAVIPASATDHEGTPAGIKCLTVRSVEEAIDTALL